MAAVCQRERVHISLLGGLTVTSGSRMVRNADWPTRRSAELVALLALADDHRLVREQVIEALWPHLSADAGAANLRKAAHHARRALDSQEAVRLASGRVVLFPGCGIETDVAVFEQRVNAALRSGDATAAEQAAAAYPGDLLPDFRYEEWTQARRDHLRLQLIAVLRLGGRWERVVELDPTDEQAYFELIGGALNGGNRHAAIRWYGRLSTNLERELGLSPSAESQALYDECVAGLPSTSTVMIGRQAELARLTAALRTAEEGRSGAVALRGAPGIGKSMLCGQLADAARKRGWLVVTVTASRAGGPYAALVAAVEQLLSQDRRRLDGLPAAARNTLAELMTIATPAPSTGFGLNRHMIIGAVHRLISAYRDVTGVLLIIDDAQLADEATLEAWEHLARAGGMHFLGAVAYRPDPYPSSLTRAVSDLGRASRCTTIDLGPLDLDEIAALITAAAGRQP